MLTAVLFFLIGMLWLLAPDVMLSDWGVGLTPSLALLGRRSAALYLGLAAMFFFARNAEPSTARSALLKGVVLACLMLAGLGVFELAAGHVTPKILVPVGLEVAMSLAFLYVGRGQSLRSVRAR
jgi:hypothetical protein